LKFSEIEFVSATVKAIGRVASEIHEVTETCIFDLMGLVTSSPEAIIAESVVVIRYLIQKNPEEYQKVLKQMCILLEDITVPVARASIVWMVGEYYDLLSDIGADILRIIAKNYTEESDLVKLQALTLGAKLYLKEGDSVNLLFQYILNLARYDLSYDIRDRARLIRTVLFNPKEECGTLTERVSDIFLAKKPLSQISSSFHERSRFTIASLSHLVNHTVFGYEPLSDFPEKAPDSTVRDTFDDILPAQTSQVDKITSEDLFSGDIGNFYSSEEEEEESEEEEGSDLYGSENGFYSEESEGESGEEESGEEESGEEESGEELSGEEETESEYEEGSEDEEEGSEEESEEGSEEESEEEEEIVQPKSKRGSVQSKSNQILDFFD
jgi:AP-3 complex subunit beta